MSYPLNLEDYSDEVLVKELERRRALREQGLCDYCERPLGVAPPCRERERHSAKS